ncbi:MAG TPA: glycosyltransferase family 1 protein [bacterium]|nr:glycosyltransferase family 1 protein [bacterium]
MKIGIDITSLRQENISGIGVYLKNVLENLFDIDSENEYYLITFGKKNIKINFDLDNYKNVYHIHFNIPSKLILLANFFFNYPKIDKLINKKKNIQLDCFWLPNISPCVLSNKTRLILTIHDISFFLFKHFFDFKRNLWHFFVRPKKLIKRADRIICVSENTKFDLMNFLKIKKEKIIVNHLGISTNYKKLDNLEIQNFKDKYGLNRDFLLYVGTIEPRKNLDCILAVFEKLTSDFSNLDLVICGDFGWMKYKFDLNFHKLKDSIKSRIKFLGYVKYDELPALYNSAKIFIWPSFYEGFGLPPLEALACNCVTVSSNNSSMPEIIGKNTLLCEAYNIESFYLGIKSLLENSDLYNFYKNKTFDDTYYENWKECAQDLLKIF